MKSQPLTLLATMLVVAVSVSLGWAQQDGGGSPAQAQSADQTNSSQAKSQDAYQPEKVDADTRPLSGSEYLSLGTPERARNVLKASIRADERVDSNPSSNGTGYSWQADTDVYGDLNLNRSWKRNSFTAEYDGGGTFYGGTDAQTFQFLKLAQVFAWDRWTVTLTDQATYSPESPFGYAGPVTYTTTFVGTNIILIPNQTILTGESARVSNTSIGEADYALNRRSSLTGIASYGVLDYFAGGVVNSNQINGSLGYNYKLTPHSKLALGYGYEEIRFPFDPNKVSKTEFQTPSISYAYQRTGRLSFQVTGGAQLARSISPGFPTPSNTFPYAQGVVSYAWHRTLVTLLGSRSVLSGGGLYPATHTTLAQLSLARTLSRKWDGGVMGGFAQNSPLREYEFGPIPAQKSHAAYVSLDVHRSIGRYAGLYFIYSFQRQVVNNFCTGSLCAQDFLRHSFGVGFDWRFRPITFHVKD